MFLELLKIINVLKNAAKDVVHLKKESDRKEAIMEMMKIYFLMQDAYDDGVKLLSSVDENPVEYIKKLNNKSVKTHLDIWGKILRRQSNRLYTVSNYISSQSYLAVYCPESQNKITEIIGNKMDRVKNLHDLGAGLFFRTVFTVTEAPEITASLVADTLSMNKELLDKNEISKELHAFNTGLNDFRSVINTLADKNEILLLSQQAREQTKVSV